MNTIGIDKDLSKGQVSQALLKKASWRLQQEIKQGGYGHVSEGDVIATSGCDLSCKRVYHTVCAPNSAYGKRADKVGFLIYYQLNMLEVYLYFYFQIQHVIPFYLFQFSILNVELS